LEPAPGAGGDGRILTQELDDSATCPEARLLVTDREGNEEDILVERLEFLVQFHDSPALISQLAVRG
jgi:hypothetical protein